MHALGSSPSIVLPAGVVNPMPGLNDDALAWIRNPVAEKIVAHLTDYS